jgi:hypothetical protein
MINADLNKNYGCENFNRFSPILSFNAFSFKKNVNSNSIKA